MNAPWTLLVSCEHGGRELPAEPLPAGVEPRSWAERFADHEDVLDSHRGWDRGARIVAERLARRLRCPLFVTTVTRLVVDVNRSLDHPRLFSEFSRDLPQPVKDELLERHWFPYRTAVETAVAQRIGDDESAPPPLLHLSMHSFTPVWEGVPRDVDVGLLFDPGRPLETNFCTRLEEAILHRRPDLRVRDNEPYRGVDDGLTAHLRDRFPGDRYLGIEIELSQRFHDGDPDGWEAIQRTVVDAVAAALPGD